jgi:hypothetical protein
MIKYISVVFLGLVALSSCDSTKHSSALNDDYNQGARVAVRDLVHGDLNFVTDDIESGENVYIMETPRAGEGSFYSLLNEMYGIKLVEKPTWNDSQCRGYNMVSETAMRERFGYTFYEDALEKYTGGATVYRLVE